MITAETQQLLVFTDLDGSLLDHHNYSYLDAQPQLHLLEHRGIPVIPATSKTRVEVEQLREQMGSTQPFIVENGAAVFIPVGYFDKQPQGTVARDGYWVHELCSGREHWLALLARLLGRFPDEYDYFFRAGTSGIVRMTNLSAEQAERANQREYSEPVQWLGSDERKVEFISCLRRHGACVLQGGRFLSVSGDCDKGRALAWLRQAYLQAHGLTTCRDLAIGDSGNDCAMLEVAETALLVRSPVHDFPALSRSQGVIYSTGYGPAGWAEGVARWLYSLSPDQ
jgi:mannosyl-3-phosphoglycerate phosphatase